MQTVTSRRRSFGSVRKLASGRYLARYKGPDGITRYGPITFTRKGDADAFLATVQADIVREAWKAPRHSRITLCEYATTWIAQRPVKESTRDRYQASWTHHIEPRLGSRKIGDITPAVVREWYAALGEAMREKRAAKAGEEAVPEGSGSATQSHAYRLLKAILNTAVDDELIPRNPCRIKGASTYQHAERPTLDIDEIEELARTVPERYRAAVYVLAWGAIRLGEATELRRQDVDLKHCEIRIERAVFPLSGKYQLQTPKSRAGIRTVVLPQFVIDELRTHMATYSPIGPDGLVFPTRSGRCAYNGIQLAITRTLRELGHKNVRVHDLRHSGQLLAATNGATLADLQRRMGHSSVNAAMAYAHASRDNGRSIAERMNAQRATVVDITSRTGTS
jgi:integrase